METIKYESNATISVRIVSESQTKADSDFNALIKDIKNYASNRGIDLWVDEPVKD